jgi:hypothetical protein
VNPEENAGELRTTSTRLDDAWLQSFYKECGREVTLAYTTLNQMKNWAMIVVAAAISGLAFGTGAHQYPDERMYVGVVIVYTFVLRFFIRAVICYVNLSRWNVLQSCCVDDKLLKNPSPDSRVGDLPTAIKTYYFRWLSPIDRKNQLISNLKLGFGLLFALPLFFMVWGFVVLRELPLVQALTVFALGSTFVEFHDYFRSMTFDDSAAAERRKTTKSITKRAFPIPTGRGMYIVEWLLVLVLSVTVAVVQHYRHRGIHQIHQVSEASATTNAATGRVDVPTKPKTAPTQK